VKTTSIISWEKFAYIAALCCDSMRKLFGYVVCYGMHIWCFYLFSVE